MQNHPTLTLFLRIGLCLLALFVGVSSASAARFTTVIIDPGHGGRDKGAFWGGVRESHLNLAVANQLVRASSGAGLSSGSHLQPARSIEGE